MKCILHSVIQTSKYLQWKITLRESQMQKAQYARAKVLSNTSAEILCSAEHNEYQLKLLKTAKHIPLMYESKLLIWSIPQQQAKVMFLTNILHSVENCFAFHTCWELMKHSILTTKLSMTPLNFSISFIRDDHWRKQEYD